MKGAVVKERNARPVLGPLLLALTAMALSGPAEADDFAQVSYDAPDDQLVVSINYQGTNPGHQFSLKWGRCLESPDGHSRGIVGEVLDSQWQDPAQRSFQVTTRFSLTNLACRPADVTLRIAPEFHYTLHIPAKGTGDS